MKFMNGWIIGLINFDFDYPCPRALERYWRNGVESELGLKVMKSFQRYKVFKNKSQETFS